MSIITISRGTKSGGILVAEAVGKRLDAKVLSRESLQKNSKVRILEDRLWSEMKDRPLHLFDGLLPLRRKYLAVLRATLLEHAAQGPIVYHANGGQMLLSNIPCVFRVRVVAPMEQRLKLVVARRGGNEAEALAYIKEKDENRKRWTKLLYGINSIDDPLNFDLVINIDTLGVDNSADLITSASNTCDLSRGSDNYQRLANEALAARVIAELAKNEKTEKVRVTVVANKGTVNIMGDVQTDQHRQDVIELAKTVDGVEKVIPDIDLDDFS